VHRHHTGQDPEDLRHHRVEQGLLHPGHRGRGRGRGMTEALDERPAPAADPELELTFPPKPEYVRTARHTVAALARLHDLPDEVVDDVKLAVSEGCTNAVAVNAASNGEPPVSIVAWVGADGMDIRILDRGPGIDPGLLDAQAKLSSDEFTFEKGLSLPLIKGLVDQVEILPRDDGPGSV